jgi:hypothetical protein
MPEKSLTAKHAHEIVTEETWEKIRKSLQAVADRYLETVSDTGTNSTEEE